MEPFFLALAASLTQQLWVALFLCVGSRAREQPLNSLKPNMASPNSSGPDPQAGPAAACSLGCGALITSQPPGYVLEDPERDSIQITSPQDIVGQVAQMSLRPIFPPGCSDSQPQVFLMYTICLNSLSLTVSYSSSATLHDPS